MYLNRVFYIGHFSQFEDLILEVGKISCMKKGEPLLQEPSKEFMHYILSGVLMSYYVYENGKEKISGFFGRGQIVPYVACLPIDPEYIQPKMYLPSRCLNDVSIVTFKRTEYMRLFDQNAGLRTAVYNWMVYRHDKYEYETFFLSNSSTYLKVCAFLYTNSDLFEVFRCENLILTQDDLGSILGESRVDVARAYKKLRDQKIISTYRGGVKLLNRDKLADILGHTDE